MNIRILLILCLGLLATGCATSRGVIDVTAPETANPQTGVAVAVVEVKDRRAFQIDPPRPSIPSLKNNEIGDRTITSRAIARKRNSYGMGLGDILLPEGKTVDGLVRDILENALRNAGYVVVSEGSPDYASARMLRADVRQFWGWMTPGFWQITLEFEAQLTLEGDWPVAEGSRDIFSRSEVGGMAATDGLWTQLFDTGTAELTDRIATAISRPPQ